MEAVFDFSREIILTTLLASCLMLVVSSRLLHCIKLASIQGIMLGLLAILSAHSTEAYIAGGINIAIKGILLPILLIHALHKARVPREVEPFVSYSTSLILFIIAIALSFCISNKVISELRTPSSELSLPVAITTIYTGLFLIITRRKALTQAIGFLIFENGIGLFGQTMTVHHSIIVELGILLDVFVLIFVMGIALFQIRKEFHHIDTDKLNKLSD